MAVFLSYTRLRIAAIIIAVAALPFLPAPGPVQAEANSVIVVKSAELKPYRDVLRGFKDACRCQVEELQVRDLKGREKALRESPDAIVTIGTAAFKEARDMRDIPLVYTMVMPSETTFLQQPNISGVSMNISPSTCLNAMRDLFPRVNRVGLFSDPRNTGSYVDEAVKAAQSLGIELVVKQVLDSAQVPAALDEMQGGIDVLWMLPDSTVVTDETFELLLLHSFRRGIPVFSFAEKYVAMGAVASLDVDPFDIGVQAAEILDRTTAGHQGPVRVYARKARLSVNRNVAEKMRIKIRDEALKKWNVRE